MVVLLQAEGKAQMMSAFGVGYHFFPARSESFQHFFSSYNAYNAYKIKTGFDKDFGMYSGPVIAWKTFLPLGDNGFLMGFDIGFGKLKASNFVEFVNDDRRYLTLDMLDITPKMLLGWKLSLVTVAASFGIDYMPASLEVFMKFNDGTLSYGNEYTLNGIYEANRVAGIAGGLFSFSIGESVLLSLAADYVFKPGKGALSTPETFDEFNSFRTFISFPKDLALYLSYPYDYNNVVSQDMGGLKYTLTLNYVFGK